MAVNSKHLFLLLIPISSFCISCVNQKVDRNELAEYVLDPNNGLHYVFEEKGHQIDIQYRPSNLHSWVELSRTESDKRDSILNYYQQFTYIMVDLTGPVLMQDNLHQMINNFSNGYSNAVFLNGEQPIDIYAEDSYQLNGGVKILAVFKSLTDKELDLELSMASFGLGRFEAVFSTKDISNIPDLMI